MVILIMRKDIITTLAFFRIKSFYAGSNSLIYRYDSSGLKIPFVHSKVTSPYNVNVNYYNGNTSYYDKEVVFSNNNQTEIKAQYVTDYIVKDLEDGNGNLLEDGNGNVLQALLDISEDNKAYVTKIIIDDGAETEKN